ncbi:MAG TPA: hypothetical protein GXX36_05655 [Clostridiaceae bacterium]|nr:hypothetical protein [Clostridiaceae bacterium]HHV99044.1 hypothetical protein [Clostridiaceae bacterium]
MSTSAVDNQNIMQGIINGSAGTAAARNTGELGKTEFLNLLITQLRYQDPLNPVDDKEFIAQLAQFSSLEQMQNMNSTISKTQAYALLGKKVEASVTDESTKVSTAVQGYVSSVKTRNGKIYVVVNDRDIPIENVTNVIDSSYQNSNISAHTGLIGTNIKGCVYDPSNGNVILVSGIVQAIQKGIYEDYAVVDGVNCEMSGIVNNNASNLDDIEAYLQDNLGKEVSVYLIDRKSNVKVPVKATLKDYTVSDDGIVNVTLNDVLVPIESVYNITKPQQTDND